MTYIKPGGLEWAGHRTHLQYILTRTQRKGQHAGKSRGQRCQKKARDGGMENLNGKSGEEKLRRLRPEIGL